MPGDATPPYPQLRYCVRCCMPETTEGIQFDEMGICQACQSAEQKIHINWAEREQQLREILETYKRRAGKNYDCIIPISGGKDSAFQLHVVVKVYGMKPLAVTFNHNWYSEVGRYNLENALEKFNVDHIMFTPNRALINALARTSLSAIGDACWHCHAGVGAFPLQVAVRFQIPLLIWGESIAEDSGRATYANPVITFDRDYFTRVSAKLYPEQMVGGSLTARDLHPFELPSYEEIERVGVVGIHLGDFIFWDYERQMEFVRDTYGWREGPVEGTYKGYKSVECIMAGVHDYSKFIKRGFGRATDHVSADVRAGLLTREEALGLVKQIDPQRPEALDYYLKITGLTEQEFIDVVKQHREGAMKRLPDTYPVRAVPVEQPALRPAVVERLEAASRAAPPPPQKKSAEALHPEHQGTTPLGGVGLHELSASAALRLIRRGDLTAQALLEACLAQIDRLEDELKSWVYLDPERARAQARRVDEKIRAGQPVGPLAGIPVGVKDIFNTTDMPTQMGSPIWKGFTPGNDARVVHDVRLADAVLPGKTVTAEFAVHAPGPTRNPHNLDCSPGTSSSGSAASVAAYMVPLALGTQTAGSIMRPASYCGVYGFKPSFGLIPRTGMLKTTDSLDTVGFFARSVDDLALMFDVVRVHGTDYPLGHAALADPTRQTKGDRPWNIALVHGPTWEDVEDYARAALHQYAETLARASDVTVEEVELPRPFARAHEIHAVIYEKTLSYYFKEEFRQRTLISPLMYEMIARGNQLSLEHYREALEQQRRLARLFDGFMQQYDVLLTVTTGGAALQGLEAADRPDACLIWTLCWAPAMSLPVFTSPSQMPFGAQVVGRRYNDYLLLKFVQFLRSRSLVPEGTNPMPCLAVSV